jgi:1-acyl-sn-glycerol-3-phosphate acyltransferase
MGAMWMPARSRWVVGTAWAVINVMQLMFTLVWTAVLFPIAMLVMGVTRGRRWPLWMASRIWAPALFAGAGVRLEVTGAEDIDWSSPRVLVCNHQSILDVCALFRAVPVPLHFVLKRELGRVPVVGLYARAMGMVFIDRSNPRAARTSLQHAVAHLREGATVVAFAEGARSRDGRVAAFKGGAFQLAIDAGVELLPVAIQGSGKVLPPHGFSVRPGLIRIRFGTPVPTSACAANDRQQLARHCRDAVIALLEQPAGQTRTSPAPPPSNAAVDRPPREANDGEDRRQRPA